MKILVINTGSSSIKYRLFDMAGEKTLASGIAEQIGEDSGKLTHNVIDTSTGKKRETRTSRRFANHQEALRCIVDLLINTRQRVIQNKSEISGIGHRVVHGGEALRAPTIVDRHVIEAIKENIPLAPLHNPPNLTGIEVAASIFPESPQVAVFDTAFHQTIPAESFTYALPYDLYKKHRIRRYGFHGTSHQYVAEACAEFLGKPLSELNLITIHLGNGSSMAALKNGKCIDTSMGMTPLEGLVMGTRCGNIDPAIPFFLANHLKMSLKEIDRLLNKDSGLKGICGANDMREVLKKRDAGDNLAQLAVEIYCYRIKKYIGAFFAAIGDLHALVFTGGIGENAPEIRELSCHGLGRLGIKINARKNNNILKLPAEIESRQSEVKIVVIPTNEELKIARETKNILEMERHDEINRVDRVERP